MGFSIWYTKYKEFSYKWRSKYFQPILKLLAKLKITPNQITAFRLLFIFPIAFCFYRENLWLVFIFYLIFWILDLFDGALARYLNQASDQGRFLDSLVDNFMYGAAVVGLIYLQIGWAWLLAANIVLELVVQLLATIKKCRQVPSDWLIKVQPDAPYFKSLAHLTVVLYLLGWNIINPIFSVLNLWLAGSAIYYFLIIYKNG